MVMNDRRTTRIVADAITSYAADREINHSNNSMWPSIRMTIGSVAIILHYNDEKARNEDMGRLDAALEFLTKVKGAL